MLEMTFIMYYPIDKHSDKQTSVLILQKRKQKILQFFGGDVFLVDQGKLFLI